MRRSAATLLALSLVGSVVPSLLGCASRDDQAGVPSPYITQSTAQPQVGVSLTGDRWPTESELASWKITRDEAIRIARAQLDRPSYEHMRYEASPVVRGDPPEQFWRVSATSLIAGGWDAEIDAHSGAILRTRLRGGR